MRASKEDFEQAGQDRGDFVVPKPGYYTMVIKEIETKFAKDEAGDEDENRPYLNVQYEIVGVGQEDKPVEENYGNVWDVVSFSEASGWKRAEVGLAWGVADGKQEEFDFDDEEVVGTKVLARLKHEKGQTKDDPPRAKVAKMKPWTGDDAFGGEGGDAEPDFGGDEPEQDFLTQEGLEAEDLKALGAIAKEFDLDPADSIVKVRGKVNNDKTKAKIIEAILEAQGADEPGDEGGEDESPF